jgi:type IV pilus biogenesis protein CpaD/CtpE
MVLLGPCGIVPQQVPEETLNRTKTKVSGGNRVTAIGLEMGKKRKDDVDFQIIETQVPNRAPVVVREVEEQQAQPISIGKDRARAHAPRVLEVVAKEGFGEPGEAVLVLMLHEGSSAD